MDVGVAVINHCKHTFEPTFRSLKITPANADPVKSPPRLLRTSIHPAGFPVQVGKQSHIQYAWLPSDVNLLLDTQA